MKPTEEQVIEKRAEKSGADAAKFNAKCATRAFKKKKKAWNAARGKEEIGKLQARITLLEGLGNDLCNKLCRLENGPGPIEEAWFDAVPQLSPVPPSSGPLPSQQELSGGLGMKKLLGSKS